MDSGSRCPLYQSYLQNRSASARCSVAGSIAFPELSGLLNQKSLNVIIILYSFNTLLLYFSTSLLLTQSLLQLQNAPLRFFCNNCITQSPQSLNLHFYYITII